MKFSERLNFVFYCFRARKRRCGRLGFDAAAVVSEYIVLKDGSSSPPRV
ncbi:hypothetical protein HMPREF3036_00685 [Sutterella sp. KLE1602]|nr:hypothetical protein HMPREF3036_00685 [Sutterella sp. KLE1602]